MTPASRPGARVEEIEWAEPAALARAAGDVPGLVWLDGSGFDARGRMSTLCLGARCGVVAAGGVVTIDGRATELAPLDAVASVLGARRDMPTAPFAFTGGLVVAFGYGFGQALAGVSSRHAGRPDAPDLVAFLHDEVIAFDRLERRCWLVSADVAGMRRRIDGLRAAALRSGPVTLPPARFVPELGRVRYEAAVGAMREAIAAGEVFQANMTERHRAVRPAGLRAVDLQAALREVAPAPFGALMVWQGGALAGVSPERFLSVDAGGRVEARPIKGTRRRGATGAEDAALAGELAESAKDRAENLMIVDLMRNDLGRVCEIGSVAVTQLHAVESFARAHHLVSVVEGRLRKDEGPVELLAACLPGGSVTGAPKIAAMELIDRLEASRRGFYCGSVAWIGHDGRMDSNIVIRGVELGPTTMVAASGGAVTWDSDPAAEYEEMRVKVAPVLRAFGEDGA